MKVAIRHRVWCDKNGWPIELIRGRPLVNVLRRLLYARSWVLCHGVVELPEEAE